MTQFSAATPQWARALVAEVCSAVAVAPPARVRWMRRARSTSSGVTRRHLDSISVVAGTDALDQRHTLLHELAHWLTPAPIRRVRRSRGVAHHDRRFYAAAFALYLAHGFTAADALAREASRYPSSLRHAVALGVPGAETAARERRGTLRARAAARAPMRVLVAEHRIRLVRDGRWTVCEVCGHRIVGPNLARLRRRGGRHTLLTREAAS